MQTEVSPLPYKHVHDLRTLFQQTDEDVPLARFFLYQDTQEIARMVGMRLPRQYVREDVMIKEIRRRLEMDQVPMRPCCGTVFEGRRWVAVNEGRPIKYEMNAAALISAYPGAPSIIVAEMMRLHSEYGVEFIAAKPDDIPDLTITAEDIDGRNGTLGFAAYFEGPDDNLDVGGEEFVSVRLVCDSSELWDEGYFRTVFAHELLHAVGLDHAPPRFDDIMLPRYSGARIDYGVWSHEQLIERYIGTTLT